MNERNVQALEQVIMSAVIDIGTVHEDSRGWEMGADRLARHLAAAGVLVPLALTDDECVDLWYDTTLYETGEDQHDFAKPDGPGIRAELERIAKGET